MTSNDYDALIRNIYPAVSDTIILVGGSGSQYGRVYIAIKPEDAIPNECYKGRIKRELKKYSVASVIPELIDPSIRMLSWAARSSMIEARLATNLLRFNLKLVLSNHTLWI